MANFYASYPIQGSSGGGGSGTVTSVGLVDGSSTPIYDISGSPVTTAGDLTFSLKTETANKVFAGPTTGAAAQPTFRTLVSADLPTGGNLTDVGTDGITVTGGTGAVLGAGTSLSQHVADSTHNGYLSSTDWTTFNSKQNALTLGNLSDAGTDGITVTGGTGAVVGSGTSLSQRVADSTHNGYLSSTDWSTFNNKQSTLTIGNFTDVGTDGIVVTGGTGSIIGSGTSIAQRVADSTHNGYLSSTDWSTFNSKGSGSVTSVAMTVPSVLSISGSPVTGAGTLAVTYSGTALPVANGGTGLTSGTSGGILGYTASGTLASSAALTVSQLVIGGGAGAVPSTLAAGTNTNVLTMVAGVPAWAAPATSGTVTSVAMTVPSLLSISGSPVTGAGTLAVSYSGTALPIANGGTAVTSVTIAPTASAWAGWDANKNFSADVHIPGFQTIASAAGTTTLTVDSPQDTTITGVTTQIIALPVVSTLVTGFTFKVKNDSSGVVTVNSSGGNAVQVMAAGTTAWFECVLITGTSAASWTVSYIAPAGGSVATDTASGTVTSYVPVIKNATNSITANYTGTQSDGYDFICVATASGGANITYTLPAASVSAGRTIWITKTDTDNHYVGFAATGGTVFGYQGNIAGGVSGQATATRLYTQDSSIAFRSDGTGWYAQNVPVAYNRTAATWSWNGGAGGTNTASVACYIKRTGNFIELVFDKFTPTASGTANTNLLWNGSPPQWAMNVDNAPSYFPMSVQSNSIPIGTGYLELMSGGNGLRLWYDATLGTNAWPSTVNGGPSGGMSIMYYISN